MLSGRGSSPVHSAHVGEEREVHYLWHPYIGQKVWVRRVEERATGRFLKVEGPSGIVVSMPGWMVDPVACAEMRFGTPQVDVTALSDLKRLVTMVAASPNSQSDDGVVWEEVDEQARRARADRRQTDESDIRAPQGRRNERGRTDEGCNHARPDSDAGGRPRGRGDRR